MRARRGPALAAVLLLVSGAAAQEPEPITRLPEIHVTAPPGGALLDTSTPGRVDRLGAGGRRGPQAPTRPAGLERPPGVTLHHEQGQRLLPGPSLRGFSARTGAGLPHG